MSSGLFKVIKNLLENIEYKNGYYVGGTLCFDIQNSVAITNLRHGKNSGIMIAKNGKGSTFGFENNFKFVLINELQNMNKEIYKKYRIV